VSSRAVLSFTAAALFLNDEDMMGQIESIVYKPNGASPTVDGYTRVNVNSARLVAGHGIEGDTKAGGRGRHLNVMCADTVSALGRDGFRVAPGQLGEQLIVSGLDVDGLAPGARILIGSTAIIQVSESRAPCGKFERHQSKRIEEARGRLGVMASVLESGEIRMGDTVTLLADPT